MRELQLSLDSLLQISAHAPPAELNQSHLLSALLQLFAQCSPASYFESSFFALLTNGRRLLCFCCNGFFLGGWILPRTRGFAFDKRLKLHNFAL